MITIGLTVAGRPRPKGSLKCLGGAGGRKHVMVESVESSKPWKLRMIAEIRRTFGIVPIYRVEKRARVIVAWKSTQGDGEWTPYAGGVEVTAAFLFERERGVSGEILPSHSGPWPIADDIGDTDKLCRNLGDALEQSGLISNDRNIVAWSARKAWVPDDGTVGAQVRFEIREARNGW